MVKVTPKRQTKKYRYALPKQKPVSRSGSNPMRRENLDTQARRMIAFSASVQSNLKSLPSLKKDSAGVINKKVITSAHTSARLR